MIAISFTGNPQLVQSHLLTMHQSAQSDYDREILCLAMQHTEVAQSLGPVLDNLAHKQATADHGTAQATAPGPVITIIIQTLQKLLSNPAIDQLIINLIISLLTSLGVQVPPKPVAA